MALKSNLFAGVAGYVGRSDQQGQVGVFVRHAGSDTWEHRIKDHQCWVVTVHPKQDGLVLAGTSDGVYRSTDGGRSFARTDFPKDGKEIWSIMVDHSNPGTIFAGGSPIEIYRSDDFGATWRTLPNPGLADRAVMPFACRVMRMAQHPTNPKTIYAAIEVNGVLRSDDAGETWTDISGDLIRLAQQPHLKSKIVSNTYNEGMLDSHAIAIAPADPDRVVLAVRMGLFESTDKGATWQDMEVGRFAPMTYGRDIKVSPVDGTWYAALSVAAASHVGGIFTSKDLGKTWKRFDNVTVHGTVMAVAPHQTAPDRVFLGARYDGEVFGTEDGGKTWQSCPLPTGVKDIYALAAA